MRPAGSRAPARTPQSPKNQRHWEGEARKRGYDFIRGALARGFKVYPHNSKLTAKGKNPPRALKQFLWYETNRTCSIKESERMLCELQLDRFWAREEGLRPSFYAHLAVVLALALPTGFCGDGLHRPDLRFCRGDGPFQPF